MKVVVLSDTHIPHRARDLQKRVWEEIDSADLVVHAGDFTSYEFLRELKMVKELKAVYGNMDEYKVASELPEKLVFEVEGVKIGLIHGFGAPLGLESRVKKKFEGDKIDVLIYGHSHRAVWKKEDDLYILNPGTPTDTIFSRKKTFAILEIYNGKVDGEIITL